MKIFLTLSILSVAPSLFAMKVEKFDNDFIELYHQNITANKGVAAYYRKSQKDYRLENYGIYKGEVEVDDTVINYTGYDYRPLHDATQQQAARKFEDLKKLYTAQPQKAAEKKKQ